MTKKGIRKTDNKAGGNSEIIIPGHIHFIFSSVATNFRCNKNSFQKFLRPGVFRKGSPVKHKFPYISPKMLNTKSPSAMTRISIARDKNEIIIMG